MIFPFSVCKGNSTLQSRQGLRKSGSGKNPEQLRCAVFPDRPLDRSPCSVVIVAGEKEKCVSHVVRRRGSVSLQRKVFCGYKKPCDSRAVG